MASRVFELAGIDISKIAPQHFQWFTTKMSEPTANELESAEFLMDCGQPIKGVRRC
jgi:hypothetical protein